MCRAMATPSGLTCTVAREQHVPSHRLLFNLVCLHAALIPIPFPPTFSATQFPSHPHKSGISEIVQPGKNSVLDGTHTMFMYRQVSNVVPGPTFDTTGACYCRDNNQYYGAVWWASISFRGGTRVAQHAHILTRMRIKCLAQHAC